MLGQGDRAVGIELEEVASVSDHRWKLANELSG